MEFYNNQKKHLETFLKNSTLTRSVMVFGDMGLGKSHIIHEVTTHVRCLRFTFEEGLRTPFESITQVDDSSCSKKREQIVMDLSTAYLEHDCILYENFEFCDTDSLELIRQVLQFHEENNKPAVSIFECNLKEIPAHMKWENMQYISFSPIDENEMKKYIKTLIKFQNKNHNQDLTACDRLAHIANGNLYALHLGINVLCHRKILIKQPKGQYLYSGKEFPDNLLFLYLDLFKELEVHMQEALRILTPFEGYVYLSWFKDAFTQCKLVDTYLDDLSRYQSFIFRKQISQGKAEEKAYAFTVEDAKNAVTESTQTDTLKQLTSQLHRHLEDLYKIAANRTDISEDDKIHLLILLTKIRNGHLTIGHLPYFVALMQYYFDHSAYRAVICQAEIFLNANVLNARQIADETPVFFELYFRALLAVGQYNTIISFLDKLSNWELRLLIAYAYYNSGDPQQALRLCGELESDHPSGEIYSLKASIYDWLGESDLSKTNFGWALKYAHNNAPLKYTLYKKYSLYIDFALSECKGYIKKALDYYQRISLRQYAETLHNYGTDSIISFDDTGLSFLEQSQKIFSSMCEKEIYYPQNSIAINNCLYGHYEEAIKIWEKIPVQTISVEFCRLAIQNNLFCAYIKNNNLDMAVYIKKNLEEQLGFQTSVPNIKQISKEKQDVQHQVRQFFLNCALLDLAQGNEDRALEYFLFALECSKYHSTMLYLIQSQLDELQKTAHLRLWHVLHNKIVARKLGHPGDLADFFAQHHMYYCIIMFWGDY